MINMNENLNVFKKLSYRGKVHLKMSVHAGSCDTFWLFYTTGIFQTGVWRPPGGSKSDRVCGITVKKVNYT